MSVGAPRPHVIFGSKPPLAQIAGHDGLGREGFDRVGAREGYGTRGHGNGASGYGGLGYGGLGYDGLGYDGLGYDGLGDDAPAHAGIGLTPPIYGAPYGDADPSGGEPTVIRGPRPCAAPLIIRIGHSLPHAATPRVVYGAPPCGF